MRPKSSKFFENVTDRLACAGAIVARGAARPGSGFRNRSTGLLSSFRRDRRAAAAVEFSLIALVSLELLTEGMQAGMYFYTSAGVERATSKSVRQILTGGASGSGYTADQFRSNVVCPR